LIATNCYFFGGPIFITFGKMFLGIVLFGLAHGLIVLPVLLSLIPGIRVHGSDTDEATGAAVYSPSPSARGSAGMAGDESSGPRDMSLTTTPPSAWTVAFRRYAVLFFGLLGAVCVIMTFTGTWIQCVTTLSITLRVRLAGDRISDSLNGFHVVWVLAKL
jgi:uncharacterized membrane protein YjjP (DUF1212 family)